MCFPTEVVPTLHHLRYVDLGGSLRDLYYLVIANLGQTVFEDPRHQPAGCIVTSTHATLVYRLP